MTSALFGRNVVASSATLSRPVTKLLWQAYAKGAEMRGLLAGTPSVFKTAIIDDLTAPSVGRHASCDDFMTTYKSHLALMLNQLEGRRYRIPLLQRVAAKTLEGWHGAVRDAVANLHSNQAWTDPQTDKKLSIGLVRMANIRPAVEMAGYLTKEFPHARVACYHSQHFPIQRFHIERSLDFLLTRKDGDAHILNDPEIRAMLDHPDCDELMLIVVATPVEEIGRDHDFDWTVIEPSSTQSIVQTAGRVNRHRLNITDKANIAILQFNRREVEGGYNHVFQRPGLEIGVPYRSHDLAELFDWAAIEQIDARMRFGRHLFSELDDMAIEGATKSIFARITSTDQSGNLWMALDTYTKSPLREADGSQRVELALLDDHLDGQWFDVKEEDSKDKPVSRSVGHMDAPAARAWLSKSDQALRELSRESGIDDIKLAMTVIVRAKTANDVARHPSFGFYTKK